MNDMPRVRTLTGPEGSATIVRDDDGQISSVSVTLYGELPTLRSARFNRSVSIASNRRKKLARLVWFLKICTMGDLRMVLWELQRQQAGQGKRTEIQVSVARKRRFKDKKNLYVAVDELLLDALVRQEVIYDDNDGNIELECKQVPKSADIANGQPYVFLLFRPHPSRCSQGTRKRFRKELAERKHEGEYVNAVAQWPGRTMLPVRFRGKL